jgi:hypothetical protein
MLAGRPGDILILVSWVLGAWISSGCTAAGQAVRDRDRPPGTDLLAAGAL